MFNAFTMASRGAKEQAIADKEDKVDKQMSIHDCKYFLSLINYVERTEKMLVKYNRRVSNFAKDMLITPTNLEVRQKPPAEDMCHSPSGLSLGASIFTKLSPTVVQEPMKFGSHSTNIERVASNILTNQKLDPCPSARTILGSDERVLDLRPLKNDKFLGHSGQFRTK
jgi:hypothetical protein